jgi:Tol biopolymer transport system component
MNIMILISLITFVLGLATLALVILNRFPNYRTGLIILLILMFALSIGTFLSSRSNPSLQASTPTSAATSEEDQALNEFPSSPVSPLTSPVATPEPTITEIDVSEIDFEGCLLFTSNRSDDIEIYKIQGDLSAPEQLTDSSGLDIEPAWAPDGDKIAFASDREPDANLQIYTMNADGSNQQRLGPLQPGENIHPSWSPDGRQIVFQSKRDTNGNALDDNYDIYIMSSEGTDSNFLVVHSADDVEPSWSPDGRKIAFLSDRSGQDEIYLMNPDGQEITQLTNLNILKSGLSWASDSQHIIFEGNGDIYSVNIATKEVTKPISFPDSNEATPLWTQANNFLIFSSDQTENWELYALIPSNSAEFRLAQLTNDLSLDRSPDWFPCE